MASTDECDFLDTCPIFEQFRTEGAKNVWKSLYCQGSKQEQCERRRLRIEGKEVPLLLLPSGTYLFSPVHRI